MFLAIDVERAREQISVKGLAAKTGMKYDTLLSKLNGRSEFTRSEMLKIQSSFARRIPLEELFQDTG